MQAGMQGKIPGGGGTRLSVEGEGFKGNKWSREHPTEQNNARFDPFSLWCPSLYLTQQKGTKCENKISLLYTLKCIILSY